jgi:hypothetical protein
MHYDKVNDLAHICIEKGPPAAPDSKIMLIWKHDGPADRMCAKRNDNHVLKEARNGIRFRDFISIRQKQNSTRF